MYGEKEIELLDIGGNYLGDIRVDYIGDYKNNSKLFFSCSSEICIFSTNGDAIVVLRPL